MSKKILIVTDAYKPQVNGVVTTIVNVEKQLRDMGHQVKILSFKDCKRAFTLPLYKEVTMGIVSKKMVQSSIEWADAIHIATPEGSVGFRVRGYCVKHDIPFTTGYHTNWPEFVRARMPIHRSITYLYLRWLHKHSQSILVPTPTALEELEQKGFKNLSVWTRGVDREMFQPEVDIEPRETPVLICVSRASHEKGLDDFCSLKGNYKKVLAGDGPYLETLKEKYPDVEFLGMLHGKELADVYAGGDVFVFPSRTDTFGVVMIEAMACGTPVAAYPVTGPIDVIEQDITGVMDNNLEVAVEESLKLNRSMVYENSLRWTWKACGEQFYDSLYFRGE